MFEEYYEDRECGERLYEDLDEIYGFFFEEFLSKSEFL